MRFTCRDHSFSSRYPQRFNSCHFGISTENFNWLPSSSLFKQWGFRLLRKSTASGNRRRNKKHWGANLASGRLMFHCKYKKNPIAVKSGSLLYITVLSIWSECQAKKSQLRGNLETKSIARADGLSWVASTREPVDTILCRIVDINQGLLLTRKSLCWFWNCHLGPNCKHKIGTRLQNCKNVCTQSCIFFSLFQTRRKDKFGRRGKTVCPCLLSQRKEKLGPWIRACGKDSQQRYEVPRLWKKILRTF